MNPYEDRDRPESGEPAGEHDPVAGFFAEARAQVRDEPATDLEWHRIVQESRRTARRRSRTAWLSSAAVAVIAVVAVLAWQQQGVIGGVQRGQAINASQPVVRTGAPTALRTSVSAAQNPTAVPKSFRTWSLSNAGQGTLYALGSQACGADVCPVLLKSGTNGSTWAAVHTFTGTDVSAATGTNDVPHIQPERAITQTRFATPQVGFVFGGDLWATTDSGSTFSKLSHPGATVLDVEISNEQAVLLSADNCAQGECNGPIHVTRFKATGGAVDGVGAQTTPSTAISGGRLVVQNGQVIVQLTSATSDGPLPPMRLDGSSLRTLNAPAVCNGTQLESIAAATITKNPLLYAVCDPKSLSGNRIQYTLVRSDNAGNSWRSVSIGALILPRLGDVWLAVADADHIAASAGGPRDTSGVPASSGAGSLVVSTNGGQGFGPAHAPKGTAFPRTGFDWLASPGARYLYAIPRTTPGFWMTSDFGGNWTVVDPRH
jgi:hypothetical protein